MIVCESLTNLATETAVKTSGAEQLDGLELPRCEKYSNGHATQVLTLVAPSAVE